MFNLSGCNKIKECFMNEYDKTDRECKWILSALEKEDREALKDLFTQQTVKSTEDLEEGLDYLQKLYKGPYSEVSQISHTSETKYIKGKHSREIDALFRIKTEEETYILYMNYWQTNTINPEMEGIYALGMVKEKDKESSVGYIDANMGIYYPGRTVKYPEME